MTGSPVPRRLTVDGEVFEVRPSENGHGHHFDWVSGPNPGYGFSTESPVIYVPMREGAAAGPAAGESVHVQQIRDFFAQIDPDTGYIRD